VISCSGGGGRILKLSLMQMLTQMALAHLLALVPLSEVPMLPPLFGLLSVWLSDTAERVGETSVSVVSDG
jgi:hypothetical protein